MNQVNLRAHYAAEIWKRSFLSTIGPTVHTNSSRIGSSSKTLSKPEELENADLRFSVDEF